MQQMKSTYPIGKIDQKWGDAEKAEWLALQSIKRSYKDEVVDKIKSLNSSFDIEQYGVLSFEPEKYPLFVLKNKYWTSNKPVALITGGVHGYETSGVQGALSFLETQAKEYSSEFNIIVAPCVSPWGYETINRWNPYAIDPNRSFIENSPAEESAFLMKYINSLDVQIAVHVDLHETTDTDNTEFRPALSARDNVEHKFSEIPDGFYLVGDIENPVNAFQAHIINSVSKVTHIAEADSEGKIIGVTNSQHGVINYAKKALGLCTGFTNNKYCTTTEVYPDSPKVDDEICILAQVVAVTSGLDFVIKETEN